MPWNDERVSGALAPYSKVLADLSARVEEETMQQEAIPLLECSAGELASLRAGLRGAMEDQ